MKLYNVLTQQLESFEPRGDAATVYVCGITPYDTTHLGHAFTYVAFDVLIRYLEYKGYPVKYVQNVTDIDDDILRKAKQVGEDWQALGNRWTVHFINDLQTLNVRSPDHFPRATEVISQMIETVQALIEAGVAYEKEGSVYFQVDAWDEYGKLSRLPRAEMLPIANQRGKNPDDPHKRHPLDFVLWQAQAPGEPAWDSPWGPGRPGWHIECSTMASDLLGDTIDIHGGGADLLFPHHESEIAQAECATGQQPFVRFWLHTAMVEHEGEKMSKSLGNLVMVRDLLKEWSPDGVRLYLAEHHYQDRWAHNQEELAEAEALAQKLKQAVRVLGAGGKMLDDELARAAFEEAMDDDLDTNAAAGTLDLLADEIIDGAEAGQEVAGAQQTLRELCKVFGLRLDGDQPEERVVNGWQKHLQRFEAE